MLDPLLIVAFLLAAALTALAVYAFRLNGLRHIAEAERAAAQGQAKEADVLRLTLNGVTGERDEALRKIVELQADARNFDARMQELLAAKEALTAQFHEVGAKLLNEAQKQFLERAEARFAQAGETNEAKLKALLQPVETTLKTYQDNLTEIEKARVGSYGELNALVAQLSQGNDNVRRETQRLANVLRSSPKSRGRWGEEQLRTILESAGLAENVDFTLQTSVSDGERQLRPDCVISLPGDRTIVVDVKCPLVAFEQAFDEEDENRRAELLQQHAAALKSYAADLGRKSYWRQFDLSPEFVIMFVPGEHFLSAAAERAPDLIETAFRNGVIVASTINMLALAKVMAGMWRQENLAAQAREIGEAGRELYKRLNAMAGHVSKLGRNLAQMNGAYNDFIGSLETKVYTQARRFEALGVDTGGAAIESPPVIESSPRPLTKLASGPSEEAA
jgi:DNA recombination protein RmuC